MFTQIKIFSNLAGKEMRILRMKYSARKSCAKTEKYPLLEVRGNSEIAPRRDLLDQ